MSWKIDLQELAIERPEVAKIADMVIKLRKTANFSSIEAFESVFGTDLAQLLLSSDEDFEKMIAED